LGEPRAAPKLGQDALSAPQLRLALNHNSEKIGVPRATNLRWVRFKLSVNSENASEVSLQYARLEGIFFHLQLALPLQRRFAENEFRNHSNPSSGDCSWDKRRQYSTFAIVTIWMRCGRRRLKPFLVWARSVPKVSVLRHFASGHAITDSKKTGPQMQALYLMVNRASQRKDW